MLSKINFMELVMINKIRILLIILVTALLFSCDGDGDGISGGEDVKPDEIVKFDMAKLLLLPKTELKDLQELYDKYTEKDESGNNLMIFSGEKRSSLNYAIISLYDDNYKDLSTTEKQKFFNALNSSGLFAKKINDENYLENIGYSGESILITDILKSDYKDISDMSLFRVIGAYSFCHNYRLNKNQYDSTPPEVYHDITVYEWDYDEHYKKFCEHPGIKDGWLEEILPKYMQIINNLYHPSTRLFVANFLNNFHSDDFEAILDYKANLNLEIKKLQFTQNLDTINQQIEFLKGIYRKYEIDVSEFAPDSWKFSFMVLISHTITPFYATQGREEAHRYIDALVGNNFVYKEVIESPSDISNAQLEFTGWILGDFDYITERIENIEFNEFKINN